MLTPAQQRPAAQPLEAPGQERARAHPASSADPAQARAAHARARSSEGAARARARAFVGAGVWLHVAIRAKLFQNEAHPAGARRSRGRAARGQPLQHHQRFVRLPPRRRGRAKPAAQHCKDGRQVGRLIARGGQLAQLLAGGAPCDGAARGGARLALAEAIRPQAAATQRAQIVKHPRQRQAGRLQLKQHGARERGRALWKSQLWSVGASTTSDVRRDGQRVRRRDRRKLPPTAERKSKCSHG